MKEKIERLSQGNFEYELPYLCLSEDEITISVEAGKVYEGSFIISNNADKPISGIVYSSCRFLKIQNASFGDVASTITYHFNALAMKAGDVIEGKLNIISDIGERELPFKVQIEAPFCNSSMGKIKDLFQFTNLARMDWSDAKKVFRSEEFETVFLGNEPRYQLIYRSLIKSISTSQALEEFLVTIRKKAAIILNIDKTQVEYRVSSEKIIDKLTLTKNQWGYAEIRVSTDAPFIQLEQKFLWADRFIGNSHQIAYVIDPENLRYGNNYGHIWIKTAHQTLTVTIVCKYKKSEHKASLHRQRQKIESGLIDTYLSFRLNQIDLEEYIDDTEALISKLPGPEVSYIRELMKTHLAIISGKSQLAKELLADFSKEEMILKNKSVLEYCAYLYLAALYHKEEATVKKASETIRKLYTGGYSDWRILWFLLYLDKSYEKNKGAKLADIREQFNQGCRSPILYYEAVCIFNEEPYLLRELSEFEIQTMNYGIKKWIVSKETAKQYTYLAGKQKSFDQVVFQGLIKLYDEFDNQEILSVICSMLIKGYKKSEKYFEWYRLGVEAQLRITELYEYYMYSISDSMQYNIAQPVLLYFIYNSNLNDSRKAFLYASAIKNKESNEAIYSSYYKKMELYALKMLEGHYINPDLAVLYHEFLNKNSLTQNIIEHLPYVMYRHELVCKNPNMVSVLAVHKELGTEELVPLTEGRAFLDIYTSNSAIFLIDSFGNRYVDSVEYTVTPLMNSEEFETICLDYSNHPMLLLHLFDRYQIYRILNDKSIIIRKKVLLLEGLAQEYVINCYQTLVEYYYENYNHDLLEYYLDFIDLNQIRPEERTKFIEYMLIRGFYKKALDALECFGFEGIPIHRLVKLCSGWLKTAAADRFHETMLNLCHYVFSHDKYDEAILRYLIHYYNGSTRDMFLLWQVAQGFEMDCHKLEERLLTQMLYAQSYLEDSFLVFSTYYKEITNHLLVRAFLSYYAYRYLLHDQVIDQGLFSIMRRELFYEENDVSLLAWLKYHATADTLSDNEKIFTEYNLQRLMKKGIVLPFFLEYRKFIALPERLTDKWIISYQANPASRVFVHYRMVNSENQDYITELMNDSFMGIRTKEFILFHHEELQYYITEETDVETSVTESFHIRYECEAPEEESNYSQINQMQKLLENKDEEQLISAMSSYARKEYLIDACFKKLD